MALIGFAVSNGTATDFVIVSADNMEDAFATVRDTYGTEVTIEGMDAENLINAQYCGVAVLSTEPCM